MKNIKTVLNVLLANIVGLWWDLSSYVIAIKKKTLKIINNCKLCIKYPFLYPRNRFTDLHYNNWKLKTKSESLIRNSCKWETDPCCSRIIINKPKYYLGLLLEWIHKYPLQLFHCIPTYTELDNMPDGWRIRFGLHICEEIKDSLLREGGRKALYRYRITDIKEKWGYLHWYDAFSYKSIHKIIRKYEDMSYNTCIVCGKKARYITKVWITPICENCAIGKEVEEK